MSENVNSQFDEILDKLRDDLTRRYRFGFLFPSFFFLNTLLFTLVKSIDRTFFFWDRKCWDHTVLYF